ncbi:MAG: hypothetical protein HQ537_02345 [Parcubacteria group bacterium]|nr:hypothetical protein [Parcubacteria group bacterium]
MPNIFICGYKEKADAMKNNIDWVINGIDLQDEAITSIAEIRPESCDGKKTPMPYLWIRSTDVAEIHRIINAFKKGKIIEYIEWDVVGGSIPAEKMK